MRSITPPIKGHRGLDFSFPKHTPVFHFLHHGPRNKDRHLNGKQNDPENLEKRVVDQQGNAHKKHKAVDPRPSLSKYFLIANQEGTEKINGHPISARNVPAQTDKRRKNPLSFSAEGEMVTGPCAGCRRENSKSLFQGMLYKFMPSLP